MVNGGRQADQRITRRGVLRSAAAGSGAFAAGLLAGCEDGAEGAPGGQQPDRPSGTVDASRVPAGGGLVLTSPPVVITQPVAGAFHAFIAVCPHQGCSVTRVEQKGILCPCHSSFFDPASGQVTGGPAQKPLTKLQVRIEGTAISYS